MAGAFRGDGNTNPSTEWNATVDPEAFAAVLAAWSPERAPAGSAPAPRPLIVGLDVTEAHHLVATDVDALAAAAGGETPVVRFVREALAFYFRFHAEWDGFHGAYIHDAMAVAIALDPALVRAEAYTVDVETAGRLTTGETVADRRRRWGQIGRAHV